MATINDLKEKKDEHVKEETDCQEEFVTGAAPDDSATAGAATAGASASVVATKSSDDDDACHKEVVQDIPKTANNEDGVTARDHSLVDSEVGDAVEPWSRCANAPHVSPSSPYRLEGHQRHQCDSCPAAAAAAAAVTTESKSELESRRQETLQDLKTRRKISSAIRNKSNNDTSERSEEDPYPRRDSSPSLIPFWKSGSIRSNSSQPRGEHPNWKSRSKDNIKTRRMTAATTDVVSNNDTGDARLRSDPATASLIPSWKRRSEPTSRRGEHRNWKNQSRHEELQSMGEIGSSSPGGADRTSNNKFFRHARAGRAGTASPTASSVRLGDVARIGTAMDEGAAMMSRRGGRRHWKSQSRDNGVHDAGGPGSSSPGGKGHPSNDKFSWQGRSRRGSTVDPTASSAHSEDASSVPRIGSAAQDARATVRSEWMADVNSGGANIDSPSFSTRAGDGSIPVRNDFAAALASAEASRSVPENAIVTTEANMQTEPSMIPGAYHIQEDGIMELNFADGLSRQQHGDDSISEEDGESAILDRQSSNGHDDNSSSHDDDPEDYVIFGELFDEDAELRSIRAEAEHRLSEVFASSSTGFAPLTEAVVVAVEALEDDCAAAAGSITAAISRRRRRRSCFVCVLLTAFVLFVALVTGVLLGGTKSGDGSDMSASNNQATSAPDISPPPTPMTWSPPTSPSPPTSLPPQYHPAEKIATTTDLYAAVDGYLNQTGNSSRFSEESPLSSVWANTTYRYPAIGSWDVSAISNFSYVFAAERNPAMQYFNEDLSGWNVSAAVTLENMFFGARIFNQNLTSWDVSKVRTMHATFRWASSFDSNLDDWDVSAVTDFTLMFDVASSFASSNLSGWNTSRAVSMKQMFVKASKFNGNLSAWDVSRVTNMRSMFLQANSFDSDLSAWDTSNVRSMRNMFNREPSFTCSVSTWDVSRVTDMFLMFTYTKCDDYNLSNWDVSNVVNMGSIFYGATKLKNSDLSRWNVSKVENMVYLFHQTAFNGDISRWDVSRVTRMNEMFAQDTDFNGDISQWDVSSVQLVNGMFEGATSFNGNLSSWNLSAATNMRGMFKFAYSFNQNLCTWGDRIMSRYMSDSKWVFNSFLESGCPNQSDPNFSASPPGPFCHECPLV